MILFPKASGILGMNARNLLYVSGHNSLGDKRFADDKIFTKRFLQSRHIGAAKLYHIVRDIAQLTPEFFDALPESFVAKPNRGYAGGGILVIERTKGDKWVTVSGRRVTRDDLFYHCIEILDGKYSISGTSDQVLFEERLEPHPDFRSLTSVGLPDVRVIVFNLVPVMAMLRVPNDESEGKANMELGAVGMGIDMGTGRTTGAAYHDDFIRKMPNGEPTVGFSVPYWDDILLSASRAQKYTKIGFLGVDMVVTKTGVKVLELNARPGLKIQIANRTPLRTRLEKVSDVKILDPEDAVTMAKRLFSASLKKEDTIADRPILGNPHPVVLNAEQPLDLMARVSLMREENIINEKHYTGPILDITIEGVRLKLPVEKGAVEDADIQLAGKYLHGFYIDPAKKVEQSEVAAKTYVEEKVLRRLDDRLAEIDRQIALLSYINPRNLSEQKTLFLAHPDASPRFFYREVELDTESLRKELRRLPAVDHVLYPLYAAKIREIDDKLSLIESRDSADFAELSHSIFGKVTKAAYQEAVSFIKKEADHIIPDDSPELEGKKVIDTLREFLDTHKLSHWKISLLDESVADIQITKKGSILLKKDAVFRSNRLQALLVHEIGTHVFRYENGRMQPFRLLERGTVGYLRTEEGLAVWNQNQLGINLGDKKLRPAYLIIAAHMAQKMGFVDLFHFLKSTYNLENDEAWHLCLKVKRGYKNTDRAGAFTKDIIYWTGLKEVETFFKKGGEIADIYLGKISVKDIPLVRSIPDIKEPRYRL